MDFLRLLAEHRSPAATAFFRTATWLGEELFVVAVLCMLYWCIHKRFAYRICFVYFISGIVVQVLKVTFRIDRPWVLDPDFLPVESAMATATGYSFPSGHTQAATALFGSCLFLVAGRQWKRNWQKIAVCCLCAAAIAAVGMSRMYLGVHTPKDVLVSFAVSIVPAVFMGLRRDAGEAELCGEKDLSGALPEKRRRLMAAVFAAAGLFAAGYALILCSANILEPQLAADCVKAGGAGIGFALGWYLETGYIR
ncbi:MAG: phosphatase PAP2 family protein, partial [Lachnospiraceae bacterium]|nr:phosphatase PAP2 family protein [Lachnospiraceae bacterium]